MQRVRTSTYILVAFALAAFSAESWRPATEGELKEVIPARAQVEKEHIETELRTASGITDGKGRFVAGVVLITAGYSAEGKYSHFFVTQVPIKIAGVTLRPGEYVFGWKQGDDPLQVKFYTAQTGKPMGTATAPRVSREGRIESFRIYPPDTKASIQIGRFAMPYELGK